MDQIRIIHVGDIHYPESNADRFVVDRKDAGAPAAWVSRFSPDKVKQVSEAIVDQSASADAVLLSGDLTSRASMAGYRSCLEYLKRALRLTDASLWQQESIHVVPGNHDVERALAELDDTRLFERFEAIRRAWQDLGLPVLVPNAVRTSSVTSGRSSVSIFSINSCIGCGDTRNLPERIRDDLTAILTPFLERLDQEEVFELLAEQLDTPAVLDEHLNALERSILGLPKNQVPVILGHHGILPQARPRLAIYTELLNGGYVRQRLASVNRPVIYCHGHIHVDTVELVSQPRHGSGRLVSIAAPLYEQGFNVLRIRFGRSGAPLGCEVVPFRLQEHGGVREQPALRIPLQPTPLASTLSDRTASTALRMLQTGALRFEEIRNTWPSDLPTPQRNTLRDVFEDLEWLGLVRVLNRDAEPEHWIVQGAAPSDD